MSKKPSPFPPATATGPSRGGRAPYRPSLKLFPDDSLRQFPPQLNTHPDWDRGAPDGAPEEVEKEEEERVGGETMDDVIRTAKEVSSQLKAQLQPPISQIHGQLAMLTKHPPRTIKTSPPPSPHILLKYQVRRLIRGSSVTSCASSELVPLQEDRSWSTLSSSVSYFNCPGSTIPTLGRRQ